MMTVKLTLWRIRASGLGFICKSFDMTNAFATGSHQDLLQTTATRCADQYSFELLCQHRKANVVWISASDAVLTLEQTTGGRMGDSNEPEPSAQRSNNGSTPTKLSTVPPSRCTAR